MITRLDFVPHAAQGIVEMVAPVDLAWVRVFVDGVEKLFEFDNNGSQAFSGSILVPIGGSNAACAANLASAINLHWGDRLRASADSTVVDVVAHHPGISLTLTSSPQVAAGQVQNAQRLLPTGFVMVRHQVNGSDVRRGKIVLLVRLDYIEQVMVEFLAPTAGPQTGGWHLDWTGHVVTSAGKIELINAGGAPFSEAHWMQLLAIGDRYEQ